MGNSYVIRSFARKSKFLLYLLVDAKTGVARFIAKHVRSRQVEKVPLSVVATAETLSEIGAKSNWNIRYGQTLQTALVSDDTKKFINACWDELNSIRPQFCIEQIFTEH